MPIRILIADDFPVIRRSIGHLLQDRADMSIVGQAKSYGETLTLLSALRPDVLLLDLQMPAPIGFQPEKIERLAATIPCVVIAMSFWADEDALELSYRVGARDFLDKKLFAAELAPTVIRCAATLRRDNPQFHSRHQCFLFEGSPSYGLARLAAATKVRLDDGYRCLYLNSPPMVAGMRAHLAAHGIDVGKAVVRKNLVLSSDQNNLVSGHFDIDRMLDLVREGVEQATAAGFKGLWAAGDIAWELGPDKDFGRLLEYEWRIEEMFAELPLLAGVCQYHAGSVPRAALRDAIASHSSIFMNESLSRTNPRYVRAASPGALQGLDRNGFDELVEEFCYRPQ